MKNRGYDSKEYTLRIANATPVELVVLHYELLLLALENAELTIDSKEYYEHIRNAKTFLRELTFALDLKVELSSTLLSLYQYVNKLLIDASIMRNEKARKERIEEAHKLIFPLYESWKTVAENEEKEVLQNRNLYAGLTYTKDGEMDEVWLEEENGFDV